MTETYLNRVCIRYIGKISMGSIYLSEEDKEWAKEHIGNLSEFVRDKIKEERGVVEQTAIITKKEDKKQVIAINDLTFALFICSAVALALLGTFKNLYPTLQYDTISSLVNILVAFSGMFLVIDLFSIRMKKNKEKKEEKNGH